jgi:putative transposase
LPYTPQENRLCERIIRTIKRECVWQHRFETLDNARRAIAPRRGEPGSLTGVTSG